MLYEHVVKGKRTKPRLFAKEERMFSEADNLFKGALISILAESMLQVYMDLQTRWDALRSSSGSLMLATSCTSWSSFMTT
jgi:hypothetical protein